MSKRKCNSNHCVHSLFSSPCRIPRQSAYADLTFPNQQGQQEQSEKDGEKEGEYSSGKYVQIREMQQEIRDQAAREPVYVDHLKPLVLIVYKTSNLSPLYLM